jgi:hypothetical protein
MTYDRRGIRRRLRDDREENAAAGNNLEASRQGQADAG